ncbi:MAG: hypothetical protein ABNH15_05390 [Alcanivorax sp.]|jgi:hypothetical protein|nr:MAG: hypothetical protein COA68_07410 [Oceanobacter sp.]
MNKLRTSSMWGVLVLTALLSACSDRDSNNSNATVDLDVSDQDPDTSVLLTALVDDLFQQSADSESVEIQNLDIVDNADEYSFDYLIQGE